jgi:hypothetical protein
LIHHAAFLVPYYLQLTQNIQQINMMAYKLSKKKNEAKEEETDKREKRIKMTDG